MIGQSGVELAVVELIVAERSEELEGAVACQFVLIGIAAESARVILSEQNGAQGRQRKQPDHASEAGCFRGQ